MNDNRRIITVLTAVGIYNLVDQFLIRNQRGITLSSVVISISIALILYIALIFFFGKKHIN